MCDSLSAFHLPLHSDCASCTHPHREPEIKTQFGLSQIITCGSEMVKAIKSEKESSTEGGDSASTCFTDHDGYFQVLTIGFTSVMDRS